MNDRQIAHTTVRGLFLLPMGFSFFRWGNSEWPRTVSVSTVCLDGAHLEDPIGMCDPEIGFETMIFLAGYSSGTLYQEHHSTKEEAIAGHARVVKELLSGSIDLAIPLRHYTAQEAVEGNHTEHAEHVKPMSREERTYIEKTFKP